MLKEKKNYKKKRASFSVQKKNGWKFTGWYLHHYFKHHCHKANTMMLSLIIILYKKNKQKFQEIKLRYLSGNIRKNRIAPIPEIIDFFFPTIIKTSKKFQDSEKDKHFKRQEIIKTIKNKVKQEI